MYLNLNTDLWFVFAICETVDVGGCDFCVGLKERLKSIWGELPTSLFSFTFLDFLLIFVVFLSSFCVRAERKRVRLKSIWEREEVATSFSSYRANTKLFLFLYFYCDLICISDIKYIFLYVHFCKRRTSPTSSICIFASQCLSLNIYLHLDLKF